MSNILNFSKILIYQTDLKTPSNFSFSRTVFILEGSVDDTCSVDYNDCDECHQIFDDDLTTFMTLKSRDGNNKTSFRTHRLEIKQTCVNTSDVCVNFILIHEMPG